MGDQSLYFCFQRCTPPSVLRVDRHPSSLACTTAWVVVFRPVSWWECELAVPRSQLQLCKRLLSSQQSGVPSFRHKGTGQTFQRSRPCLFVGLLCLLSKVFLTSLASPARSLALPKESLRVPCEDNDDAFCNLFDVLNGLEEGPIVLGTRLLLLVHDLTPKNPLLFDGPCIHKPASIVEETRVEHQATTDLGCER